jgi:beta-galactosidase
MLAPLLAGTEPRAEVAILLDYDSRWALQLQPHNMLLRDQVPADYVNPSPVLRVEKDEHREPAPMTGRAHLLWPYAAPYVALWERNVAAAIVAPESDLSGYKVVIAPFLKLVSPAIAENLKRFVAGGGTLVLGPRAGFKDENSKLFPTPQPGPLAELTGATVKFFDSMEPDRLNVLRWDHTGYMHRTEVGLWAEVLEPHEGTTVLAYYQSGWYANAPAITLRTHPGGGRAIYVGGMGGPDLYANLFDWLLPQVGVEPLLSPVVSVEVCERVAQDGRRVVFVLNHGSQAHSITLARPVTDILTSQRHERSLHLKPHQVVIYEQQ